MLWLRGDVRYLPGAANGEGAKIEADMAGLRPEDLVVTRLVRAFLYGLAATDERVTPVGYSLTYTSRV